MLLEEQWDRPGLVSKLTLHLHLQLCLQGSLCEQIPRGHSLLSSHSDKQPQRAHHSSTPKEALSLTPTFSCLCGVGRDPSHPLSGEEPIVKLSTRNWQPALLHWSPG
ncbi:hypothetical protein KIL84_010255 [Mauremys mutica]|uniref:Uncharacterized protein n=1 Tax=Mauremys mutica TaxID=74926 RepID=A0A9D3XMC6_9SAUR|nr:hypothetical protein KIL84_010255 [Mauremys mutica]